jgi:hypothetical protein
MITEAGYPSEGSIPRRDSKECKALLDAATRELFLNNAFRITGLSVDATSREIAKHMDRLTVLDRLGLSGSDRTVPFPLKAAPTIDQIREAFERLNKSPERRMVDEFFWFWPSEFGKAQSDPAIQALVAGNGEIASQLWAAAENNPADGVVAKHNLAVLWHLKALDLENERIVGQVDVTRGQQIEEVWRNALKRWEVLIPDDALWDKVAARIRQIDEPALTTGFARRMRSTLHPALNKINAELALSYAKAGKMELAKVHVQFMRETNQDLNGVAKTAELVLAPTVTRIRQNIERAILQAESNPETGDQAARELITGTLPLVAIFDLFFGGAENPGKDLFDEVADNSNTCLVKYQGKTGGNKTFVELLESTLPLAKRDKIRNLILQNIEYGRRMLLRELLESIRTSAALPGERLKRFELEAVLSLRSATSNLEPNSEVRNGLMDDAASVLSSISVDAWNKFKDKRTAIKANDLATDFVCDAQLRQVLEKNRLLFKNKRPPSQSGAGKSSRNFIGCWFWIAIFVIYCFVHSCHSNRVNSSKNSYRPSSTAAVSVQYSPLVLERGQASIKLNYPNEKLQRMTFKQLKRTSSWND